MGRLPLPRAVYRRPVSVAAAPAPPPGGQRLVDRTAALLPAVAVEASWSLVLRAEPGAGITGKGRGEAHRFHVDPVLLQGAAGDAVVELAMVGQS